MNCEIFHQLPWYTYPYLGLSYHASAKAGTQTLLRSILREFDEPDPGYGQRRLVVHRDLVSCGEVLAEQIPTGKHCVQIVRHPAERFASLFRDKCLDGGDGVPAELYNFTRPEQLLDYIKEDPYGNVHWTPQSTVVGAHTYTTITQFGLGTGFHENKSVEPMEPLKMPVWTEVLRIYRTDCLLYADALGGNRE